MPKWAATVQAGILPDARISRKVSVRVMVRSLPFRPVVPVRRLALRRLHGMDPPYGTELSVPVAPARERNGGLKASADCDPSARAAGSVAAQRKDRPWMSPV